MTDLSSNLTFSHLPFIQNHFGTPFKFVATIDICQKSKTSTAQNQTQLQGDKIWNYHAQLSQVLHSFRTAESRFYRVTLPIGPHGVIFVDIVPCILYVIQDMQEGNMLCGRYGPHMPQIQRQLSLCNVDYKGMACHNVR
jgi:hypothetical protein